MSEIENVPEVAEVPVNTEEPEVQECTESSLKRTADETDSFSGVKSILVDVEGTTCPISFVRETLLGYIRDNARSYVDEHFEQDECTADIEELRVQAARDVESSVDGAVELPSAEEDKEKVVDAVVANINWQLDQSRYNSAIQRIKSRVMRDGFKKNKIQSEIYPDVLDAFKEFQSTSRSVYIFSTGSCEAQRLVFGYSNMGDLLQYLNGHFDTETGSKTEKSSYTLIAEEIGNDPEEVLFLTDSPEEAKSAMEAGMRATIVVREGNVELTEEQYKNFDTITSFTELYAGHPTTNGGPPAKK